MKWLNEYIGKEYEDGGRGPDRFDCYGLVREIRARIGYSLLPSFGQIRNTQPKQFTQAYKAVSCLMQECKPEVGAIAAVFRGSICLHVAIVVEVDGQLAVIEINPKTNCRWLRVPEFERRYLKVIYYR